MADSKGNVRLVKVETSLGQGVFRLCRLSGTEELGRLYAYTVELESRDQGLKLDKVLGEHMTVTIEMAQPGDPPRYFHGLVSEFAHLGSRGDQAVYQATLRPWLWFLTRTADCRIFQAMSVPKIIEKVFSDHGFSDFEISLRGKYPEWEYCVQYRETDFNFVSRLMEQEGIYYYHKHQKGKHVLVLVDDPTAHAAYPGCKEIPYKLDTPGVLLHGDCISHWTVVQSIQPGRYATTDYNFQKPKAGMAAVDKISRSHGYSSMEVFDYPGEYDEMNEGEGYARIRLQELQVPHETAQGQGNARGVAVGHLFSLTDCPRQDQNREYLVTSASYRLVDTAYESGAGGGDVSYDVSFAVSPSRAHFRSARVTPKPVVQGAQTARVVGPGGEEIYTDKYGRIKVQFHWDREGKGNESSSCWMRVSTAWAGATWGMVHVPRIGHEVIVSFLEGDPDQPLVTGSVYNANMMPPYELPNAGMVSGIKTNTTPGGGGYNELSMDDTKGKELITIHGQFDMATTVEHDRRTNVGNNRTESIGKDETITVGADRTESVGKDEKISIKKNRTESVGESENITIGKDQTLLVDNNRTIDVGKDENVTIGKTQSLTITDARKTSVGQDDALSVGKKLVIDAGDQISITTGSASIVMKKDGTITIKGKNITLDGTGKINVKASGDVVIKGSKVTQN